MDDLDERLQRLERDVTALKRVALNPVLGLLEWLGNEGRRDVARVELAQAEERGRLLAVEALLRALLATVARSPATADAFERSLAIAEADLVALALSDVACKGAARALRDAAAAWRALVR